MGMRLEMAKEERRSNAEWYKEGRSKLRQVEGETATEGPQDSTILASDDFSDPKTNLQTPYTSIFRRIRCNYTR
jgi:hypothetical protein